jgi:phytoene synthase
VNAEPSAAPLASFEAKWSDAYPEFGLALRFLAEQDRDAQSAFACLVFELEHAAFGIREAQPASVKLAWWAEEFSRAAKGEARHPLTHVLAERIGSAAMPVTVWQQAIVGAFAQRDPEPAADAATLLDAYGRFYAPIGKIEAALFGTEETAIAAALTNTRALRETAALADSLRDGKLPVPLDVLARHRLSRGDLGVASRERDDMLREWFGTLAAGLKASLTSRTLGVLRAAMVAANASRASRTASSRAPLEAIRAALSQLSVPVLWASWRVARRSRR